MLRQKFMLVLGVIVALHVVMALLSIALLHAVFRDLDAAGVAAVDSATAVQRLSAELSAARRNVDGMAESAPVPPQTLAAAAGPLRDHLEALAEHELMREPRTTLLRAQLEQQLNRISSGSAPITASAYRIGLSVFQDELGSLEAVTGDLAEQKREDISAKFRLASLGLGIVFILVINATVMVMSRMVSMIVKPVDTLVDASRRLAREEFGHRVELDRSDEFAELAGAYNALADQLQQNEQRKVETLHQVARTLNHELNNAIAVIELQITHLARRTRGDDAQAERLREIHRTLERISRTVRALTHVRRIVLTDYTSGVSMLDLDRSVQEERAAAPSQSVRRKALGGAAES